MTVISSQNFQPHVSGVSSVTSTPKKEIPHLRDTMGAYKDEVPSDIYTVESKSCMTPLNCSVDETSGASTITVEHRSKLEQELDTEYALFYSELDKHNEADLEAAYMRLLRIVAIERELASRMV